MKEFPEKMNPTIIVPHDETRAMMIKMKTTGMWRTIIRK